ncbi:MAG: hypothetical protein D3910_05495, partial [Candidatus Electrothrix sp. ATG2]|nr:hypothetical protein [Candidatus Electrothrix sp. ATG2]
QRSACLNFSHRLITRLKREGIRRVHIAFTSLPAEDSPYEILRRCRTLLSEAERRGPYSLCDEAFLVRKEQHPFALPAPRIVREVQKKWRGLDQFGLLLVSSKRQPNANDVQSLPDLASTLPNICSCHLLNACEQLILFPSASVEQTDLLAIQLSKR